MLCIVQSMKTASPFGEGSYSHDSVYRQITVNMRKRLGCLAKLLDNDLQPGSNYAASVDDKNASGWSIAVKSPQRARDLALERRMHVAFLFDGHVTRRHCVLPRGACLVQMLRHRYVVNELG